MKKEDDKRWKALEEELVDIEGQLAKGQENKKALSAKLKEMDKEIRTEYAAAVDQVAVSDVVTGDGVLHKVMTTKAFDTNRNIRQQREKLAAGLDAIGKHLNQLTAKKKQITADIARLENKSMVESLKKSFDHLLEAIKQAEDAYVHYHRLLSEAPANAIDVAKRAGVKDEFFFSSISRKPRPGDNLLDWIIKSGALAVPNNPLYGRKRESGESEFRRGGLFHGPNAHFQNS